MGKGKKYNHDVLLQVIQMKKPTNPAMWNDVAQTYATLSGEGESRGGPNVEKYFIEKMCNSQKKITGDTGTAKNNLTIRSQQIYRSIMTSLSTHRSNLDDDSDYDSDDNNSNEADVPFDEDDDIEEEDLQINRRTNPQMTVQDPPGQTVQANIVNAVDQDNMLPTSVLGVKRTAAQKTKNSRKNPRTTASGMLGNLSRVVQQSSQEGLMVQMMQTMQATLQQTQRPLPQQDNGNNMMMMFMMQQMQNQMNTQQQQLTAISSRLSSLCQFQSPATSSSSNVTNPEFGTANVTSFQLPY
jgi:hypothetical protein